MTHMGSGCFEFQGMKYLHAKKIDLISFNSFIRDKF